MAKPDLPTPEELRQLLRYEPETGKLYWLERPETMFAPRARWTAKESCLAWNRKNAGREALTANSHGYRVGAIYRRNVPAHRVAFALYHGRWPIDQIDHINGNRSDNRISNLREVTNQQNQMNRTVVVSRTGLKGVTFCKRRRMFSAQIQINGKNHGLGFYRIKEDAAAAYQAAAAEMFGEYASRPVEPPPA